MKPTSLLYSLLMAIASTHLLLLVNGTAVAKNGNSLPGLSAISDSDIRNSAIDFVNTSSSPGLEGATLTVDNENRDSDQWRSSLGFNAEVTLKEHTFNAYWGLGVVGGSLDDKIRLTADNGKLVQLNVKRDIVSVHGSLGLSLPINENFKIRPMLTLAISDVQTNTVIEGLLDIINKPVIATINNSAQMVSTTGSVGAHYWYWHDNYKLELSALYNLIYTDSFSESNPLLDTYSWSQTAQLKSRISGPTPLVTSARPWRWLAYANHTNFMTQNKTSLGYTGLFEIGTGLEWQLNVKPLDWFGWQYIGFSVGVITSRNVDGFNMGLTAR
jgi:hypothetical protein